jgi:hypothetical protein
MLIVQSYNDPLKYYAAALAGGMTGASPTASSSAASDQPTATSTPTMSVTSATPLFGAQSVVSQLDVNLQALLSEMQTHAGPSAAATSAAATTTGASAAGNAGSTTPASALGQLFSDLLGTGSAAAGTTSGSTARPSDLQSQIGAMSGRTAATSAAATGLAATMNANAAVSPRQPGETSGSSFGIDLVRAFAMAFRTYNPDSGNPQSTFGVVA